MKRLNERITLWRNDKIPYGAYYFYNNLKYLFPDAEIVIDKQSPDNNKPFVATENDFLQKLPQHKKRAAQIILSSQVKPNKDELRALLEFVWEGNYVFLSAFEFDKTLLDSLKLEINANHGFIHFNDSLTVSVVGPESRQQQPFSYPGKSYDSYFSSLDSGFTTILGTDQSGRANFIKIEYESGGAIYIHLAPMAFTNFFLLHKDNKQYYDYALSQLPAGITLIGWGEYFRTHSNGDDNGGEEGNLQKQFSWISKQQPLAAAFWLLLILFILTLVFESKRKQLLIPEIAPLRNSSLDFVKTIGRLYFQRKDNRNLSSKMAAHLLDHIRNRYNIPTSMLDDEFEKKLAYKSGYDPETLYQLIYLVKTLPGQPSVSDEDLLAFNQQLENFYKHT